MDGDNVTVAIPQSSNVLNSDIPGHEHDRIDEEGSRLCPLCQSEIRLFFINFNEKMLMCENIECEFPFGHEELQFVKEDNDVQFDEEVFSIRSSRRFSRGSTSASHSLISAVAWSEIDKMNRMCESEDSQFDTIVAHKDFDQDKGTDKRNEKEIQQHIADIKQLTRELMTPTGIDRKKIQIKNEKWIKNLKNIQEMSGVQLLKPEEIRLLRKEEPVLGLGELKIDIDPGNNSSMSTIKIEIHKPEDN